MQRVARRCCKAVKRSGFCTSTTPQAPLLTNGKHARSAVYPLYPPLRSWTRKSAGQGSKAFGLVFDCQAYSLGARLVVLEAAICLFVWQRKLKCIVDDSVNFVVDAFLTSGK